jgi:hypothetical protein
MASGIKHIYIQAIPAPEGVRNPAPGEGEKLHLRKHRERARQRSLYSISYASGTTY